MKYESKWYVSERSAHARQMARPMRSTAKQCPDADSKAEEYALWILKRDGLDLAVMAEAIRTEHNALFPPAQHRSGKRKWTTPHDGAIPDDLKPVAQVEWAHCAAGRRPRFVHFEFSTPARDGWRRSPARQYATIYQIELPYWDFALEPLSEAA